MFQRKEMIILFENLSDQVDAGITIPEAIKSIERLLPKRVDVLEHIRLEIIKGGTSFYDLSFKDRLFPENILEQIKIGESTGNLGETLRNIANHEIMMDQKVSSAKNKILPPLGILFAALCIGFAFVAYGLPKLAGLLDSKTKSEGLFAFSLMLNDFISTNDWFYPALFCFVVGMPLFIIVNKDAREYAFKLSLHLPVYGSGLKHVLWAGWANYISMSIKAGVNWEESLRMSKSVLPPDMMHAFELLGKEIGKGTSWVDATNADTWQKGDPRLEWPILLIAALRIGGPIGELDVQLASKVDRLSAIGEHKINQSTEYAKLIALLSTAASIVFLFSVVISAQISAITGVM